MRRCEHLPTPAPQEHMQGVRGREPLPALAHQEPMQGVRGREQLQHQRQRSKRKECQEDADKSMPAGLEELEEAGV